MMSWLLFVVTSLFLQIWWCTQKLHGPNLLHNFGLKCFFKSTCFYGHFKFTYIRKLSFFFVQTETQCSPKAVSLLEGITWCLIIIHWQFLMHRSMPLSCVCRKYRAAARESWHHPEVSMATGRNSSAVHGSDPEPNSSATPQLCSCFTSD